MNKELREIRRALRKLPLRLVHLTVDSRGRVVLPASLRRELGIRPGSKLVLSSDTLDVRLVAYEHVMRRVKQLAEEYGRSGLLSDELLFERRIEALAEDLDYEDAARLRIWASDQSKAHLAGGPR
jgi:AbrB family looped-hinge helix DNA binding protein